MFLEVVWPAVYGSFIGLILLVFILEFRNLKKIKKAILLFVNEKNISASIEILNKVARSILSLKERISEINMIKAEMYLILSDEEHFLDNIAKVSHKMHLTSKSFWESLYYLEKKDMINYEKSKENITKNFNLNHKTRLEKQYSLNTYNLILQLLEENEKVEKREELRNLCQTFPEYKILLKEYLSKFF